MKLPKDLEQRILSDPATVIHPTPARSPEISIWFPWPPSVNHYWRHVGNRVLLSKQGRQYRASVALAVQTRGLIGGPRTGRLAMYITVRPPDRRARDLDNLCKAILDSAAHAGLYEDDSQIDRLTVERGEVLPGGKVLVTILELEAP